jgi:hypothetical protein
MGDALTVPEPQMVVDLYVGCGNEAVELGRRKLIFNTLLAHLGQPRR